MPRRCYHIPGDALYGIVQWKPHPKRGALLGSWFKKQKPGLMEPPLLPSSCRLDWTCVMQSHPFSTALLSNVSASLS